MKRLFNLVIFLVLLSVAFALVLDITTNSLGQSTGSFNFNTQNSYSRYFNIPTYVDILSTSLDLSSVNFGNVTSFYPFDSNFSDLTGRSPLIATNGSPSFNSCYNGLNCLEINPGDTVNKTIDYAPQIKSLQFWINSTTVNDGENIISLNGHKSKNRIECLRQSGRFSCLISVSSFNGQWTSGPLIATWGTPFLITLTFDDQAFKTYLNNETPTIFTGNASLSKDNFTSLQIGNNYDGTLPWSGNAFISGLALYNYTLSAEQIAITYAKGQLSLSDVSFLNVSTNGNTFYNSSYPLDSITLNDSLYPNFKNAFNNGLCTCPDCILNAFTCSIPLNFSAQSGNLRYSNINISTSYGVEVCNTEYNYTLLNFTYRDAQTNTSFNIDSAGYGLEVSAPFSQSIEFTDTNTDSTSFCTNVNLTQRGLSYTIGGQVLLSETGYGTEINQFSPAYSVTSPLNEKIFLSNLTTSSTLTVTWLSTTFEPIDGSMKIYECVSPTNRQLVGTVPIIDSISTPNVDLLTTAYSYEVVVDGALYQDNTSYTQCHVETAADRRFFVELKTTDLDPFIGLYSIQCNLTKPTNTSAQISYSDNIFSSAPITACMFVTRTSAIGNQNYYTNCSDTENPLTREIPVNGFEYRINAKLFQGGYSLECEDVLTFNQDTETAESFGISGIFAVFLLIVSLPLMFATEKAQWFPIAGVIMMMVAWVIELQAYGWTTMSALLAFVLIIVWLGRRNKAQ